MPDHHIRVECVRVVIVQVRALLIAQLVMTLVVVVMAQNGDVVTEAVLQRLDKRCFSAAGASGDANDNDVRVTHLSLLYTAVPAAPGTVIQASS